MSLWSPHYNGRHADVRTQEPLADEPGFEPLRRPGWPRDWNWLGRLLAAQTRRHAERRSHEGRL